MGKKVKNYQWNVELAPFIIYVLSLAQLGLAPFTAPAK